MSSHHEELAAVEKQLNWDTRGLSHPSTASLGNHLAPVPGAVPNPLFYLH